MRKVKIKEESFGYNYPDLLKEWNWERNNYININPFDIMPKSGKKVWWKCKKDHEWDATVEHRVGLNSGCPFCTGQKTTIKTSFGYNHPDLLKEWDWEKNEEIDPFNIMPQSSKKMWWKCHRGHSWNARLGDRVGRNSGCPFCSGRKATYETSFGYNHPDLLKEWDWEKNDGINPFEMMPQTRNRVWWKCEKGHEWKSALYNRTRVDRTGCPFCNSSKGEKIIQSFLEMFEVRFVAQQTFDTLVHRSKLRFDFYLPDYNLTIEYQGRQHFEAVDFGGRGKRYANKDLKVTQLRDKIKRDWCEENNVELLEIPYWEKENIEKILVEKLGLNFIHS